MKSFYQLFSEAGFRRNPNMRLMGLEAAVQELQKYNSDKYWFRVTLQPIHSLSQARLSREDGVGHFLDFRRMQNSILEMNLTAVDAAYVNIFELVGSGKANWEIVHMDNPMHNNRELYSLYWKPMFQQLMQMAHGARQAQDDLKELNRRILGTVTTDPRAWEPQFRSNYKAPSRDSLSGTEDEKDAGLDKHRNDNAAYDRRRLVNLIFIQAPNIAHRYFDEPSPLGFLRRVGIDALVRRDDGILEVLNWNTKLLRYVTNLSVTSGVGTAMQRDREIGHMSHRGPGGFTVVPGREERSANALAERIMDTLEWAAENIQGMTVVSNRWNSLETFDPEDMRYLQDHATRLDNSLDVVGRHLRLMLQNQGAERWIRAIEQTLTEYKRRLRFTFDLFREETTRWNQVKTLVNGIQRKLDELLSLVTRQ